MSEGTTHTCRRLPPLTECSVCELDNQFNAQSNYTCFLMGLNDLTICTCPDGQYTMNVRCRECARVERDILPHVDLQGFAIERTSVVQIRVRSVSRHQRAVRPDTSAFVPTISSSSIDRVRRKPRPRRRLPPPCYRSASQPITSLRGEIFMSSQSPSRIKSLNELIHTFTRMVPLLSGQ